VNNPTSPGRQVKPVAIQRINGTNSHPDEDLLASEEPLEIHVEGTSIAVVMRTPGEDRELAAGFLVTEGLVRKREEILELQPGPGCREPGAETGNTVNVRLSRPESLDLKRLTRHVFSSSSCGICSKATIEAVHQQFPAVRDDFLVSPEVLRLLPSALIAAQETFRRTGGLHACALFRETGQLLALREDVGRHNALDKVIGWALLEDQLPLCRHLLLLSGRVSFEMMQKALAAGIPLVAAISAPSSLAVEFARASGQTLVGFLRDERMNVYAGENRISSKSATSDVRDSGSTL